MSDRLGIRPRARLDVVELATAIGEQSELVADRFLEACESTFELLEQTPGLGSQYRLNSRGLKLHPTKTKNVVRRASSFGR